MSETITTPSALVGSYRYIRLLGEGSNGKTYLAENILSGNLYAIKEIKYPEDFKAMELFNREAEVLKSIKINGVPKFEEVITASDENESSFLVQEFIPWPSLQQQLDTSEYSVSFSETTVLKIMLKVTEILLQLQTQYVPPVIHRDIKPSNILVDMHTGSAEAVSLIDFGAVANPQKQSGGSTIAGTFGYMAPEQLQGEVAPQSDFYSLGATALHLLTRTAPHLIPSKGFQLEFEQVLRSKAPEVSQGMQDLLELLLNPDIQKRPSTAKELHGMIQEVMYNHSLKQKTNNPSYKSGGLGSLRAFQKSFKLRPSELKLQDTKATIRQYQMVYDIIEMTYCVDNKCYVALYPLASHILDFVTDPNNPNLHHDRNQCTIWSDPKSPSFYKFLPETVLLSEDIYNTIYQNTNNTN